MNSGQDGKWKILKIHEADNVAMALDSIPVGATVRILTESGEAGELVLKSDIPFAHKVSLKPIGTGVHIVKYGHTIGEATTDIGTGEHVHVSNVRSLRGRAK